MDKWGFNEFRKALKTTEDKYLSLDALDEKFRQARFMEAKWGFEDGSYDDRMIRFFSFKKSIIGDEKFTFFWSTSSPFSQWHKANFDLNYINLIKPILADDNDVHGFTSSEQYMMFAKSMLFFDRVSAGKILSTSNTKEIKKIGRTITNFEELVWSFNKVHIVYEGNKAKFTQNEELKQALFSTQGTTLVEAAPNDRIWGIGLSEDDPRALKRETWLGKNLLGEILTQIRIELMGDY